MKRRKGNSGFTLAETLMAVLILLLVTGIVAAGIPLAVNAYNRVVDGANAQVLLSTTMTRLRDELGKASGVEILDGAISYTRADGAACRIWVREPGTEEGPPGICIRESALSEGDVGEYTHLLVSHPAANRNLYVTYRIEGYSRGVITFSGLTVKRGSASLAEIPSFKVRVLTDLT